MSSSEVKTYIFAKKGTQKLEFHCFFQILIFFSWNKSCENMSFQTCFLEKCCNFWVNNLANLQICEKILLIFPLIALIFPRKIEFLSSFSTLLIFFNDDCPSNQTFSRKLIQQFCLDDCTCGSWNTHCGYPHRKGVCEIVFLRNLHQTSRINKIYTFAVGT